MTLNHWVEGSSPSGVTDNGACITMQALFLCLLRSAVGGGLPRGKGAAECLGNFVDWATKPEFVKIKKMSIFVQSEEAEPLPRQHPCLGR